MGGIRGASGPRLGQDGSLGAMDCSERELHSLGAGEKAQTYIPFSRSQGCVIAATFLLERRIFIIALLTCGAIWHIKDWSK